MKNLRNIAVLTDLLENIRLPVVAADIGRPDVLAEELDAAGVSAPGVERKYYVPSETMSAGQDVWASETLLFTDKLPWAATRYIGTLKRDVTIGEKVGEWDIIEGTKPTP